MSNRYRTSHCRPGGARGSSPGGGGVAEGRCWASASKSSFLPGIHGSSPSCLGSPCLFSLALVTLGSEDEDGGRAALLRGVSVDVSLSRCHSCRAFQSRSGLWDTRGAAKHSRKKTLAVLSVPCAADRSQRGCSAPQFCYSEFIGWKSRAVGESRPGVLQSLWENIPGLELAA